MTNPDSARVYLAVPYAEKDAAKAQGARWDADRRAWWIDRRSIPLFAGVHRWIVDRPRLIAQLREAADFLEGELRAVQTESGSRRKTSKLLRRQARQLPSASDRNSPVLTPQTTFLLPQCSCACPPWEDCEHTATLLPLSHAVELHLRLGELTKGPGNVC